MNKQFKYKGKSYPTIEDMMFAQMKDICKQKVKHADSIIMKKLNITANSINPLDTKYSVDFNGLNKPLNIKSIIPQKLMTTNLINEHTKLIK